MENDKLTKWLTPLLSGLVQYPEKIEISQVEDEMGLLYTVKVDKEDIGKIIGKNGKTADALRTLLRAAGSLFDLRAAIKIDSGTHFTLKEDQR